MLIPKIIHYCWFGGNPLPDFALRCIDSWKKYFPDYEIKEWNETNDNLDACDYIKEAYEKKQWAFVSDYARFDILYQYGGIYFDTDVEVINSFENILSKGAWMGCEALESQQKIVPGLGLYKEILDNYRNAHFIDANGGMDITTVVVRTTEILKKHGFEADNMSIQEIEGITIYPPEYFGPVNCNTGELFITENTRSIHHYAATWMSESEKKIMEYRKYFSQQPWIMQKAGMFIIVPMRLRNKIKRIGIVGVYGMFSKKIKNLCSSVNHKMETLFKNGGYKQIDIYSYIHDATLESVVV